MSLATILFNPNGRIGAKDFWTGWAVVVAGNIASNLIGLIQSPIIGLVSFVLFFALAYMGLCVYGKRLHDMGRSAWLVAVPWGIGLVTGVIGLVQSMPALMSATNGSPELLEDPVEALTLMQPFFIWVGIGFLPWLAMTIWVGTAKPQPGDNKHGHGPEGPAVAFS